MDVFSSHGFAIYTSMDVILATSQASFTSRGVGEAHACARSTPRGVILRNGFDKTTSMDVISSCACDESTRDCGVVPLPDEPEVAGQSSDSYFPELSTLQIHLPRASDMDVAYFPSFQQ